MHGKPPSQAMMKGECDLFARIIAQPDGSSLGARASFRYGPVVSAGCTIDFAWCGVTPLPDPGPLRLQTGAAPWRLRAAASRSDCCFSTSTSTWVPRLMKRRSSFSIFTSELNGAHRETKGVGSPVLVCSYADEDVAVKPRFTYVW